MVFPFVFHVLIRASSQNGKAERKIRTINNIIRTLMAHASLPHFFWQYALAIATCLLNILPRKLLDYSSPLKILYQCDPTYSHLRIFGCLCNPRFPSTIHKLQHRSTSCVFLGYPSKHQGYLCYDLISCKIIISRHVIALMRSNSHLLSFMLPQPFPIIFWMMTFSLMSFIT